MGTATYPLLFVLYACIGFGVFIYSVMRWFKDAASTWDTVAKGVVSDIVLIGVPGSYISLDNVTVQQQTVQTTIAFDDGKRILLLGDFVGHCKTGDDIRVMQNRLGDYRIDRATRINV